MKTPAVHLMWTEISLKTKLFVFENDEVTMSMIFLCPSFTQTRIQPVIVWCLISYGVVWTEIFDAFSFQSETSHFRIPAALCGGELSSSVILISLWFYFQLDALHPAGSTLISQLASGTEPIEALRIAVEVFVTFTSN